MLLLHLVGSAAFVLSFSLSLFQYLLGGSIYVSFLIFTTITMWDGCH